MTGATTETEKDLLSALLADGCTLPDLPGIAPGDFQDEDNRALFIAISGIEPLPGPVPLSLISEQIHNKAKRARIASLAAELSVVDVLPVQAPRLARILTENTKNRRIAKAAQLLHEAPDSEEVRAQLVALLTDAISLKTATTAPPFLSAAEFLTTPPSVGYLIRNMIETSTTGQIFGPSGGGKTFTVLDWALCTVTGGMVNGNQVKQGIVLYLAGEGHTGLRRRVKAWQIHHGKSAEDLRLFHLSRHTISFDGGGLHVAKAGGRLLAETFGAAVVLIVIDTLARHLEGDENSTKDMSAFIQAVDSLRAAFPGSVALIVHHSGHGEDSKTRGRGSSALRAAMDFEVQCDKGLLTFTKMKDGETPDPIPFKLCPVVVGQDEKSMPLTSCVVEYGERAERHQEAELTHMERIAVKALIQASIKSKLQEGDKWGALLGDWREAFYELRKGEDPEAKQDTLRRAFVRSAETLEAKNILAIAGPLQMLTSQKHQDEIAGAVDTRHRTLAGQSGTCPGALRPDKPDTPLKRCPDVRVPVPLLEPGAAVPYFDVP